MEEIEQNREKDKRKKTYLLKREESGQMDRQSTCIEREKQYAN